MKTKLSLVVLFALLAGSAYAASSQAVVAYSFICNGKNTGPCPQGASPNSLIQASDGNFYGTTEDSGNSGQGIRLFGGTVFSLTPAGKFTLLHTFIPGVNKNFPNGATPISLTEGPDGKLYGLTTEGGRGFGEPYYGYGVLFRINKTGSGFQVLHKFCSVGVYCSDGVYTVGALVVGTDGNIYGATNQGGTGCTGGCGAIFRVTPSSGAYEVVFSFSSVIGGFPSGLTAASDGTFYGLTIQGGSLFHYTPAAGTVQLVTLPFIFPPGCPGFACFASGQLAFGSNGNLYGSYTVYGAEGDSGLFEVEPDGSNFQLLPLFTTVSGGGVELLLASDGNFWAPRSTGSSRFGDILTLSPTDGSVIQTLTPFGSTVFGPAEIIEAKDGTLWGVASGGISTGSGHFASGTVFSLNAGLPPR